MDKSILNKIDKTQLTKIDTNMVVHKENNGLDELARPADAEPYTPPCIHPAVHNYINLNQFSVSFDVPCFIQTKDILSVSKPLYNIRKGKYASHKVMLAFNVIHAEHFYGKPSRYDNFYTDEEIISLVEEFNEAKHSFMEVCEYDQNGVAKIKTTYTSPRIYRIEFPEFNVNSEEIKKYYIAEVHFSNLTQEKVEPEEPKLEN